MGVAAAIGFSSQVVAAEDDEEEETELEEVQVTGTRIQSPNVTSANPITSITSEEMRNLGFVNVGDALTTLVPQNISTYQPNMLGDNQSGFGGGGMEGIDRGSYFIGNTIANLRGMDPGLGTRTLTLIDGRRVVSTSNQADVVDMNIIPSNLLQRMDVVTGGASATYGSGAMAGVVNLVLNNRMQGVNVDMDYAFNEAGDGASPHVSISGGTSFLDGRAHGLFGVEWEKPKAIRDCARARAWCAESRYLFTNAQGSTQDPMEEIDPLPGYGDIDGDGIDDFPARFEIFGERRQQHAAGGAVHHNNAALTSGFRFDADGRDGEEYTYGFRGGTGGTGFGGDGPLTTEGVVMRPSSERKTLFTNFEYNITERTTAYMQGNLSKTEGLNRNNWTTGNYCVRFDQGGTAMQVGGIANPGDVLFYGGNGVDAIILATGEPYISGGDGGAQRDPIFNHSGFRTHIGITGSPPGIFGPSSSGNPPFWYAVGVPATEGSYSGGEIPPSPNLVDATAHYVRIRTANPVGNPAVNRRDFWVLEFVEIHPDAQAFVDYGAPAGLPQLGRNAYPFLYGLSDAALYQVQRGSGSINYHALTDPVTGQLLSGHATTTGGGIATGPGALWGNVPCNNQTVIRKVWNPQIQQWTEQHQETARVLAGVKGRFGADWRWDAYYQYGHTNSSSTRRNVATSLRLNMAMDSVVDDREFMADGTTPNPNYGRPVCRMIRDGIPMLDYAGVPLSDPEDLAELSADCVPINVFGTTPYLTAWESPIGGVVMSPEELRQMQEAALDYAFVDSTSKGGTSLQTVAFSMNGTLWDGLGYGPLTGAFGVEVRENKTDQKGAQGLETIYERADLNATWGDAESGLQRVTEGYAEFDLPLVSGVEGVNLLSLNTGMRYTHYYNKGGVSTTGQSASQNVFNWKVQTVFEPFDFIRARLTHSRDVRAPTYRDLFRFQESPPDQFSGNNPWRERTGLSNQNQQERWGQVRIGNPDLKNETSDTTTVGVVLSPGGWAQGMRVSVDYFTISVKDAIVVPFTAGDPITACWEESGNVAAEYLDNGEVDPNNPGINGLFNEGQQTCRDIIFGTNPDGSRNLNDILSYNSARPENGLPIKRRGVDVSVNYTFPLNRAFESLPGTVGITVRATRALEASGIQVNSDFGNTVENCAARGGEIVQPITGFATSNANCYIPVSMVGQIRSSTFIPGVAPSPKWSGNIIANYRVGNLTTSLSARYIGAARFDNTWCDFEQAAAGSCVNRSADGTRFLNNSIDRNWVDPYFNFALNGSYEMQVPNMKSLEVFGSINNLMDKSPPFTGGGLSGASAQYHDTYGRAYRMGVRMRF